jgi:hypothetical protein
MDFVTGIITYAKENAGDLWQVYASIVAAASIVIKLTPTKKDDAVLNKILSFIGKFIALNK